MDLQKPSKSCPHLSAMRLKDGATQKPTSSALLVDCMRFGAFSDTHSEDGRLYGYTT